MKVRVKVSICCLVAGSRKDPSFVKWEALLLSSMVTWTMTWPSVLCAVLIVGSTDCGQKLEQQEGGLGVQLKSDL